VEEGEAEMNDDVHIIGTIKGKERYVILFDDRHRSEALRTIGRWASDPELSFTWYDAAMASQKIRRIEPECLGKR
jgi:hypothetical protein